MSCNGKCILLWMPCSEADFLGHVYPQWLSHCVGKNPLHTLAFVESILAHILASLIHEFSINSAVGLVLEIYNVDVRVV